MPKCVPIRETKDTAGFAAMVEEASEPITVTKNGREAFVVMKPEDYEAMQEEVAKSQLLSRLMLAEEELAAGDCVDYGEAVAVKCERAME